jgi:hypothetical protein
MNSYEREYFVSRIRSGVYYVKLEGILVKILTPTIEDEFLSNEVFKESYEQAQMDSIFTEEEMWEWMKERDLWSEEKDEKVEGIQKDLDKLKVGIFEDRNDEGRVDMIRKYLRAGETSKSELVAEKNELFSKTCEGLASQDKALALFERCCFIGSEPLDCENVDVSSLFYDYNRMLLNETQLRELARNDPWRLCWIMKDHSAIFKNIENRELSPDQKGVLVWSNMYDNIQESMDCPTEDVINDDDMLDGWFILQRQKQESERTKAEMEKRSNSKIANSSEILIVTNSKKEAESIHSMNGIHSDTVRKQRLATAKKKGVAVDLDFQDRQLDIRKQQLDNFKGTGGR